MTIGRRFELLTANASRNIPRARRDELLDLLEEWLVEMELVNPEERFWILAAGAAMWMEEYCEIVQADEGTKILRKEIA